MRDRLPTAIALLLAVGAVALAACIAAPHPGAQPAGFVPEPKDRPLLESPQQVWEARATGVGCFRFGGEHYVVENLPEEYVDYSAWYVRMP